ncbi:sugar ABC transporter ATP-binding protein [Nocardioides sp. J54]|uniref:sugar ABC transporter ATP-binding protein n=1 Tax=Nocardioides sp. J54 TaxID=935866 RepID=UPI0018DCF9E5|nr:sugar ABC transporter ATP-binding protein [Nocardioides sp. J54]
MDDVRLRLSGVSKTFPAQRALSDVDLEVRAGEVHALVGENGSGKSTLIKVLSGFHRPDPGSRIEVDGVGLDPGNPAGSLAAGLRFVHQDLGLVDELGAAENVGLSAGFEGKLGRIAWRAHRARVRDLLARVGVPVDIDRPAGRLAAVERSAVAIARALDDRHGTPKVLVLDEPTAALPPAEVDRLMQVVRGLRDRGVSIIYVSHRLGEVLGVADRLTVLRDGRSLGTFSTEGMDEAALAELIVGREVSEVGDRAGLTPVPPDARPVLSVGDLRTDLVRGIDLTLREGEVLGVAGIAGSGREDLAEALAGAAPATMALTAGGVTTTGQASVARARQHGLALVLPNSHPACAVREQSVAENIGLARPTAVARRGWVSRRREHAVAREWIERLGVSPRDPARPYGLLSGGNKQKVSLARGLIGAPEVLVLDDPTSGVDIGARQSIYALVRGLAASGTPSVVCSSDLDDLVGMADRVLVLVDGEVVEELEGEDVTEARLLAAMARRRPVPVGALAEMGGER